MKKLVVVSGFPTSGKTSVGDVLSERFGLKVADLDQLIESETGRTIENLIREEGEESFRERESKALLNVLTAKKVDVITVGGGALLREANQRVISEHLHISLDVMPKVAALRAYGDEAEAVKSGSFPKRPLLAPKSERDLSQDSMLKSVVELRKKREELFLNCDLRINTSWCSAQDAAEIVAAVINGNRKLPKATLLIPIRLRAEQQFEIIAIGSGLLSAINDLEAIVGVSPERRAYLVDANVDRVSKEVEAKIDCNLDIKVVIPSGEQSKSLTEVAKVCEELAKAKFRRGDEIVAVGGGVVGDIAGLVSSLYMRGISLAQVPTTVVAQVDSSLGGKTGVNLQSGKNLVGTFEPAKLILSDIGFLSTLPEREYRSGLAEVVKYGLICSGEFYRWIEENEAAICAREEKALRRVVELSTIFKMDFVHGDLRDVSGQRAQLNFGHTIGHAIEKLGSYGSLLHGEAVAIGMVAACRLGEDLGVTPSDIRPKLVSLLQRLELPVSIPEVLLGDKVNLTAKELMESEVGKSWVNVLQLDKKRTKESANFVLLTELGAAASFNVELEAILRVVFSR